MATRSPRLKQKAVLWTVADYDNNGNPTVSAATEISCRWEDGKQEVVQPDGTTIAADAEIWVNQEVSVDSILCKGKLADLPDSPTNLRIVVAYFETPNTRATAYERRVLVQRYTETLPTIGD